MKGKLSKNIILEIKGKKGETKGKKRNEREKGDEREN